MKNMDPAIDEEGMAQMFGRLLSGRHSCRAFLPQAVPHPTIERIL
jgi:hypothetical protein